MRSAIEGFVLPKKGQPKGCPSLGRKYEISLLTTISS